MSTLKIFYIALISTGFFVACKNIDKYSCFMDFEQIHTINTRLKFEEIELIPSFVENRRFSNTYFGTVNVWDLNKEYGLKHIDPSKEGVDYVKDSIAILGQKFSITDLFGPTISMRVYISKLYKFTLASKKYLLILVEDNSCASGLGWCHWAILVDISNREKLVFTKLAPPNFCPCTCGTQLNVYPDYLGDFDQNGTLNYLQWGSCYSDTAIVYDVLNGNLIKQENKYLIIKSYEDTTDMRFYSKKRWNEINLSRSKWYYSLKDSSQLNQDTCYLKIRFQDKPQKAYIYSIKHKQY